MKLSDALALGRLDAHDQSALARRGELSATELVEAAILRIEALDPDIAAVSWRAYDLPGPVRLGPCPIIRWPAPPIC